MTRSSLRGFSIGLVHAGVASLLASLSLLSFEGTARAAGGDSCAPAPPRLAAGDSDTGSTVGAANDVSLVPLACNRIYTQVAGPDVFYELVVGPQNDFAITVTPSAGYDTSIYLLTRQCGVGSACAAGHGADDNPEGVAETLKLSGLATGTYYLGIDSFYPSTDARSSGTYSVSVTGTLAVIDDDGGAGDATTGDDAATGDDAEGDDAATEDAETDAESGDDGGTLDSGAHRDAGASSHADAGHHHDGGEEEGGDASNDDGGSSSGAAASGGCGCRVMGARQADRGPFVAMGTLGLALTFGRRRRVRRRAL